MSWRDDPRNTGQEHDLPPGTLLRWTTFTEADGDHDHCVVCWAKFATDPRLGTAGDPVLPEG